MASDVQFESRSSRIRRRPSGARRAGALLSAELLLVFPVLMIVLFGIIELSLLISSYNSMRQASGEAARFCSRSSSATIANVEAVAASVLVNADAKTFGNGATPVGLSPSVTIDVQPNVVGSGGTLCCVTISVDMSEATPDLLGVLGLTLTGKTLSAKTCMLNEF